jgi:hypothetical protein
MVGAVVVTIATASVGAAVIPFVVGALSVFVAYRHWRPARQAPAASPATADALAA